MEISQKPQSKDSSTDRRRAGLAMLGVLTSVLAFSQGACAQTHCLNPTVKTHDDSSKKASHFIAFADFSAKQKLLLESLLKQSASEEVWQNFIQEHNDQAATFLAVTDALSKADLFIDKTAKISALDMVEGLGEIRGVRLIANVNLGSFEKWLDAGGRYTVHLTSHKEESGEAFFAPHSQKGGGLHCGFDIQGYTHYTKPPYLHWNVNRSDGSSDIHLDGRTPWIWGFIPNPTHLEYSNSDVREWLNNYEEKYGNPGFTVENH